MDDIKLHPDYHESIYSLDNKAKISLLNNILSNEDADSYFEHLNKLNWNETLSTDSVKPTSHDTYWYGPGNYSYSGIFHKATDQSNELLDKLISFINSVGSYKFNSVLLNRYTKSSYLRAHKDDENSMDTSQGILAIRFGKCRDITFYDNSKNLMKTFKIENGCGYFMSKEFQDLCYHELPLDSSSDITLTATFRKYIDVSAPVVTEKSVDLQELVNEIEKAKNFTNIVDTLKTISMKIDSICGNDTFNLIKPYIAQQYSILITGIFEKINQNSTKISYIDKNIHQVNTEITKMKSELKSLREDLDNQTQYSKRNNLLIMGIPEHPNEDIRSTTETIFQKSKCNSINLNSIERVHRLGKTNPSHPRPILMRFNRYDERESLISSILKSNRSSDDRVIFREHLTQPRLKMFKEALQMRFNKKIKSAYTRDGILHIKVTDEFISIKNNEQFTDLKAKFNI